MQLLLPGVNMEKKFLTSQDFYVVFFFLVYVVYIRSLLSSFNPLIISL